MDLLSLFSYVPFQIGAAVMVALICLAIIKEI